MQTRSSSKFVGEPSTNPTSTILKRRNRRCSIQRVKPFSLVETPVVTMPDQRTMVELLRAPTEGYAEANVVPPIPAEHLELKHSLINLVKKLTLRDDDEAITFKVGQTSRYSYNDVVSINRIYIINVACEEYAQEVLGFLDNSTSGNPTPSLDLILSTSSPSLTPFEEGDFILEEIKLVLQNDSIPPRNDDDKLCSNRETILLLEKVINDIHHSPPPKRNCHVEELKIEQIFY
ncbi:hypothetical protein Tco_1386198 [Tanacetum coccineum]